MISTLCRIPLGHEDDLYTDNSALIKPEHKYNFMFVNCPINNGFDSSVGKHMFDLSHIFTSQVWSSRFWMGQFCSTSPKPHIIYSNDEVLVQRISERAGYMSREDQARLPTRTSKTYKDRFGVKRCVGLKKEMRESQHLSLARVPFWFHCFHLKKNDTTAIGGAMKTSLNFWDKGDIQAGMLAF